jgi:hypothetical protein
MVDGNRASLGPAHGGSVMKKIVEKKDSGEDSVVEKDVSDLTIKKLTLKTGVKAGRAGTCAASCCACTCHTGGAMM